MLKGINPESGTLIKVNNQELRYYEGFEAFTDKVIAYSFAASTLLGGAFLHVRNNDGILQGAEVLAGGGALLALTGSITAAVLNLTAKSFTNQLNK